MTSLRLRLTWADVLLLIITQRKENTCNHQVSIPDVFTMMICFNIFVGIGHGLKLTINTQSYDQLKTSTWDTGVKVNEPS